MLNKMQINLIKFILFVKASDICILENPAYLSSFGCKYDKKNNSFKRI